MASVTLLQPSDLYLLPIGETGSGKTALINSFAPPYNYRVAQFTLLAPIMDCQRTCSFMTVLVLDHIHLGS